jgi:hypothetical protein
MAALKKRLVRPQRMRAYPAIRQQSQPIFAAPQHNKG